jgi:glutathione synthase/RimK-type ligase-like ATP-grasp enzyme
MSQGHWQIYNHNKKRDDKNFTGRFETLAIYDTPKKIISTALKAASVVGDGLYGVDMKEDEDGNVYVVEINDNPNIDAGVEDKVAGERLYLKIIETFISRINEKNDRI